MAWHGTAPCGMAQHGSAQQDMVWPCMAQNSQAWCGTSWHSTAWQSASQHGKAPTCALQAPRQLGGEEDVHQLGAVVGGIEASEPLLPGEVAAISGARAVPEGRDVDDAGGRRCLQEICMEQRVRGERSLGPPQPREPWRSPSSRLVSRNGPR